MEEKKKLGTPGKYNEQRVQIILSSLSKMGSKAAASEAAGITYKTYQYWYNTFPEFKRRVDEIVEDANARGKSIAIQAIFAKMDTNWQAAAWWLERNFPNEFGQRSRMDMDVTEKRVVFTIGNNDVTEIIQMDEKPHLSAGEINKMKKLVAKGKEQERNKFKVDLEVQDIDSEELKEMDDPRFEDEKENDVE